MGQRSRDDKAEPSLELPSIPGLGRRKKTRRDRRAGRPETPAPEPQQPEARQAEADLPDVYDEPTRAMPRAEDAFASEGHAEAAPIFQAPGFEEPGTDEPGTDEPGTDEPTRPLPSDGAPRRRAEKRQRPERTPAPKKSPAREPRTTPLVPGRLAAVLTGITVGAAGAGGTYGAMAGCKVVRGVSSCGGAPGFLILVAILVLMVLLGTGILALFRVANAGSTSFLAVGLVTVVAMLFLLGVIFSVWMFAVIPALSGVAFVLAHWVTSRFADEDKGRRDWT